MQVGDLIKVRECAPKEHGCECFFCLHKSSRMGVVIADDRMTPTMDGYRRGWQVQFDCGEWEIYPSDFRDGNIEVISESR